MNEQLLEIIRTFREKNNDMRFGQYLWTALAHEGYWTAPEANALFFVEDEHLIAILRREE